MVPNYIALKQHIAELALRYGRNPLDITLIAVTKGHSWPEISPLYEAGQRQFGESREQEASAKIAEAPGDILWHFIGSLQKNKVRKVIDQFTLIHSVDSPDLAAKISKCSQESSIVTPLLLQVNTSGEASKHGLDIIEWRKKIDFVRQLPGIKIKGFMTIAPLTNDEHTVRSCFAKLRKLRDELGEGELPYLSMGMSHDYPWAIAEGATHLRIGSALFSPQSQ